MMFAVDIVGDEPVLRAFDRPAMFYMADRGDGELVEFELLHPRDMAEHRRIFMTISELAKALGRSSETVRAELLYATGNFRIIGELTGSMPVIAVASMARRSMRCDELRAFWDDAREVIRQQLLPQIADDNERARLEEMLR